MNNSIFAWFEKLGLSGDRKNRPFLLFPSKHLIVTYQQFFTLVDKESQEPEPEAGIQTVTLDLSLSSLTRFFALLKRGQSVAILHPLRSGYDKRSDFVCDPKEQYIFVLSSGSGGQPQWWPHTLDTMTWNLPEYCQRLGISEENCMWSAFPPSSISGLKALFIAAFSGGSLVWEPYPAHLEIFKFGDLISSFKEINALAFPPNFVEAILYIQQRNLFSFPPRIKRLICGGDILLPETMRKFTDNFHRGLGVLYGMTETAGPVAYMAPGEETPFGLGRMLKGDAQRDGPRDQKTLHLRGGFLSPQITTEWFDTGDNIVLDAGRLTYLSRRREWLLWQGEKISLLEIENHIKKKPGVTDSLVYLSAGRLQAVVQCQDEIIFEKIRSSSNWDFRFPKPEMIFSDKPMISLGMKKIRYQ